MGRMLAVCLRSCLHGSILSATPVRWPRQYRAGKTSLRLTIFHLGFERRKYPFMFCMQLMFCTQLGIVRSVSRRDVKSRFQAPVAIVRLFSRTWGEKHLWY